MKILLAVDGSEYTRRMISYLAAHPDLFGPGHAYTVFTVVLAVPQGAANFAGSQLVHAYYEEEASAVLAPLRAALATHGIQAEFVHQVGHPAEAIAAYAENGAFDLVVMGSHGHGAFRNLVLGSIVTKVLAGCSRPVLIVR